MIIQYALLSAMTASLLVNAMPDTSADLDNTAKKLTCSVAQLDPTCAEDGKAPPQILLFGGTIEVAK